MVFPKRIRYAPAAAPVPRRLTAAAPVPRRLTAALAPAAPAPAAPRRLTAAAAPAPAAAAPAAAPAPAAAAPAPAAAAPAPAAAAPAPAAAAPRRFTAAAACAAAAVIFTVRAAALLPSVPPDYDREESVAEKYAQWAEKAVAKEDWQQALLFLERARDFTGECSDLSYLLALARQKTGAGLYLVIEAAQTALETGRWSRRTPEEAALLEAEAHIQLRDYDAALGALKRCGENAEAAFLKVSALWGAARTNKKYGALFASELRQAADRYHSDPAFARLAFKWAAGILPHEANDDFAGMAFIEELLRRLPFLAQKDNELAYLAAPFYSDADDARNALLRWYGEQNGDISSRALPILLDYGVLNEETALDYLSREYSLDAKIIREVYALFRTNAGRDSFNKFINNYTGVITEDYDGDGYTEALAVYHNGLMQSFTFDTNQDRQADMTIVMEDGVPVSAWHPGYPPEYGSSPSRFFGEQSERKKVIVTYSVYPSVDEIHAGATVFRFRPDTFFHKPVEFEQFAGPFGLPFPRVREEGTVTLSSRALWDAAYEVELNGQNFEGSRLLVELNDGAIISARETLGGKKVSEDFFTRGRLYDRFIDMNLDGKQETRIQFGGMAFDRPEQYIQFLEKPVPQTAKASPYVP